MREGVQYFLRILVGWAAPALTLTGAGCQGPTGLPAATPVAQVVLHLVPNLSARDLAVGASASPLARGEVRFHWEGRAPGGDESREDMAATALGSGGSGQVRLGRDVAYGCAGRVAARGRLARLLVGEPPRGRRSRGKMCLWADVESRAQARQEIARAGQTGSAGALTVWQGVPRVGVTAEVATSGLFPGGLLSSATTGVTGQVSPADLAPTVIWALGIPPDPAMAGAPWKTAQSNVWGGAGRIVRILSAKGSGQPRSGKWARETRGDGARAGRILGPARSKSGREPWMLSGPLPARS